MTQFSFFEGLGTQRANSHKVHKTEEDSELWLRFIRDRRWSRAQKHILLAHFDNLQALFRADPRALRAIVGKARTLKQSPTLDADIKADLHWLAEKSHTLITINDDRFPELLRQIDDPPLALFAVGDLALFDLPAVAIVGSRRPSPVGKKVCQEIATTMAGVGICVVSGLALGIDGEAHRAALRAGTKTIAVLGCGIDVIYPARHRSLYQDIAENGLLVSEYPRGYPTTQYTFPDRNRIVSGLSNATVIIEAAEKSGTLITARLTVEQNRELMVVPGAALSPQYRGSHRLIQEGASLVCTGNDVLNELAPILKLNLTSWQCENAELTTSALPNSLTKNQSKVLKNIDYQPTSLDELTLKTGFSASELTATLIELELCSMVAMTPEGGYIRTV